MDMCDLEQVITQVGQSAKYRDVCPDTIRRIGQQALARYGTVKAAIKHTKSKLHQVYAAYESRFSYEQALDELAVAYKQKDNVQKQLVLHRLLERHASTQERLHIAVEFYKMIFAETGQPKIVLDLACGLNPLFFQWMNLGSPSTYYAYDIDGQRIAFLQRFFELSCIQGQAYLQDVICIPPEKRGDLALLLKTSACLEQQHKGATLDLLDALHTDQVVVSFPTQSLGARKKGMSKHYTQRFEQMVTGRPWRVKRLRFKTELAFIVDKRMPKVEDLT